MYRITDNFDVFESSVSLCLKRFLDFLFNNSGDIIMWPSDSESVLSEQHFDSDGCCLNIHVRACVNDNDFNEGQSSCAL